MSSQSAANKMELVGYISYLEWIKIQSFETGLKSNDYKIINIFLRYVHIARHSCQKIR